MQFGYGSIKMPLKEVKCNAMSQEKHWLVINTRKRNGEKT
jgi:hypothetical protein